MTGTEGTLPIEPLYVGGPVIKGFGRGSKVLGIPTGESLSNNFIIAFYIGADGVQNIICQLLHFLKMPWVLSILPGEYFVVTEIVL